MKVVGHKLFLSAIAVRLKEQEEGDRLPILNPFIPLSNNLKAAIADDNLKIEDFTTELCRTQRSVAVGCVRRLSYFELRQIFSQAPQGTTSLIYYL